jgi:hypothetical protein
LGSVRSHIRIALFGESHHQLVLVEENGTSLHHPANTKARAATMSAQRTNSCQSEECGAVRCERFLSEGWHQAKEGGSQSPNKRHSSLEGRDRTQDAHHSRLPQHRESLESSLESLFVTKSLDRHQQSFLRLFSSQERSLQRGAVEQNETTDQPLRRTQDSSTEIV